MLHRLGYLANPPLGNWLAALLPDVQYRAIRARIAAYTQVLETGCIHLINRVISKNTHVLSIFGTHTTCVHVHEYIVKIIDIWYDDTMYDNISLSYVVSTLSPSACVLNVL